VAAYKFNPINSLLDNYIENTRLFHGRNWQFFEISDLGKIGEKAGPDHAFTHISQIEIKLR
jgi:hypothetical protein